MEIFAAKEDKDQLWHAMRHTVQSRVKKTDTCLILILSSIGSLSLAYFDSICRSLQNSMKWDEERFGLEYDLDIYNIVAVKVGATT